MSKRTAAILSLVGYIGVIVAANWLTATFGLVSFIGLTVTAGTFAAGLALIFRDAVQVELGKATVIAAIIGGALISAWTSTPAIALASGIAFLVSELVDFGVFTPLRNRSLPGAVLASSVVAAPIDTVLFLHIAGFGATWEAVWGQFVIKTLLALIVAAVLAYRERKL